MSAPVLEMSSVTYAAEGRTLLGPLNLRLDSPGITCVLGPNGAGKSLFLALAHGIIPASQGHVLWDGAPAASTRQGRGFVFQSSPILRRSVSANLDFPLRARGMARAARRDAVAQALEQARLVAQASQPAAALSGGERQRLALAQAMVSAPRALLLDEPGASLDPASRRALEEMVRNIAEAGTKVIMSTHDLAAARRLADDVIVFLDGRIAAQDTADVFFTASHPPALDDFLSGRL